MFIIIYVSSKNLNSLTNFLKFFYKLKKDQALKLEFPSLQSQRKKKFSFFSTLQSPHVNKTSQEQFECQVYSKKLKIRVSQTTKFLAV
jgi:ribosomal protein S10